MQTDGLRLGVAYWNDLPELIACVADTMEDLGCQVVPFPADRDLPAGLDAVLVYGPYGSLVALANNLLALPSLRRPTLAIWMTEQFANPAWPEPWHYMAGATRSRLERLAYRRSQQGSLTAERRWRWMVSKACRFRYYGDLHWLQREGLLAVLAVGSQWIAGFLRRRGFAPSVAFIGAHPSWGADLGLERDIPVLWLGKLASDRRRKLLQRVRKELNSKGLDIKVVDGVEHPYVFGHQRTVLLNRSRIVLNLLRAPWDNHSLRFFLAAPNRTLVVSEPTLSHIPFFPGRHYVEAPADRLADTIHHYLTHERERAALAESAYHLTSSELTMKSTAGHLLKCLLAAINGRHPSTRSLAGSRPAQDADCSTAVFL